MAGEVAPGEDEVQDAYSRHRALKILRDLTHLAGDLSKDARHLLLLRAQHALQPVSYTHLDVYKRQVDYPSREEEWRVLDMHHRGVDPHSLESLEVQCAVAPEELDAARQEITAVTVDPSVMEYVLDVVRASRQSPFVLLGASPRAAALLLIASKAAAAESGRGFVVPDDCLLYTSRCV